MECSCIVERKQGEKRLGVRLNAADYDARLEVQFGLMRRACGGVALMVMGIYLFTCAMDPTEWFLGCMPPLSPVKY